MVVIRWAYGKVMEKITPTRTASPPGLIRMARARLTCEDGGEGMPGQGISRSVSIQ